jgi:hypothetical protein
MFSEEFLNDLCRVGLESQDNIRCDNCKHYISGALDNGKWFCEKKSINDIPIDIRECFERRYGK